jgi:transposase-like protein
MMAERGVKIDHTTIMGWVHQYSPEMEKKVHRYIKPTNDSWKTDETYIRVKGEWKYLYRAVDSNGNTIDFMLTAKRFLKKAHEKNSRVLKKLYFVKFRYLGDSVEEAAIKVGVTKKTGYDRLF